MIRQIATITAALAILSITPQILKRQDKRPTALYQNPPLSYLSPKVIKFIFLNHEEIYHDFLHIWLIQAFADPEVPNDLIGAKNMVASTIKHMPKIETLYLLSCFTMIKKFKAYEDCRLILEKGYEAIPNSFRIPMTLGYLAAFKLKDNVYASYYYFKASKVPRAPEYVKKIALKLYKKEKVDSLELQKALRKTIGKLYDSRYSQFLEEEGEKKYDKK